MYIKKISRFLSTFLMVTILCSLTSFPLLANEAGISIPNETFSGREAEWSSISYDSTVSNNALTCMKATQKNSKLYLFVKGTGLDGENIFFIDSDNNPETGGSLDFWTDSKGIDYKIVNSKLFKYVGTDWAEQCEISVHSSNTVLEAAVDISSLGLSSSTKLKVAYCNGKNGYLPDASKPMLSVDADLPMVVAPNVVVDGNPSEWAGLQPIATKGDTDELFAFKKGNKLFIMAKGAASGGSPIFEGHPIDILINTDNDINTGSKTWMHKSSGADYLIEGIQGDSAGFSLFKSTSSGWTWNQIASEVAQGVASSLYSELGSEILEMQIDLSQIESMASILKIAILLDWGTAYLPVSSHDFAVVFNAATSSITPDGNDGDWSDLAPVASGIDNIEDLYAFKKDNTLYLMSHGKGYSSKSLNIYINSDNNPSTGFANNGQYGSNAGGDYLIQSSGALFRSTGTGWAWDWVKDNAINSAVTQLNDGNEIFEASIDLTQMEGVSNTVKVALAYEDNTGFAPGIWEWQGSYATVINAPSAGIIIDGNDGDWNSIDTQVLSSGVSFEMYAVQDDRKLYTLVKGAGMNTQNIYYIDSDSNSSTGYDGDGLWANVGIDFVVKEGYLHKCNMVNGQLTLEKLSAAHMYYTDNSVEMQLNLDQIGKSAYGMMRIGYEGKNSIKLPEGGSGMMATASVIQRERLADTYYPKETYEVLNNPYIGWVPWAKDSRMQAGETYPQPHKLVYAGVSWRELEPVRGEFDWKAIESKYQFDFWSKQGVKINLRIVMDTPTGERHMDIPDWLYKKLVDAEGEEGAGKWYDTAEIGDGFAPNYSSPVLISEHERLIKAVAKRYNRDQRISYIQLGSLGHWGEWHNWPEGPSGKFPNLSISKQYVQHYLDNFTNKLSGMRKPFPIASENHMGLFNDMFGDKGSTDQWLGWTQNGWNEIGSYIDYPDGLTQEQRNALAAEVQAKSAMPEFWKHNYSGGEFYNGEAGMYQSLTDGNIMETLRQARESHTSWIGPSSPAKLAKDCDIQKNIDALHKTIGYRFVLEEVKHADNAVRGSSLPIMMKWNNKGIAPFYYNWPLQLSLADSRGRIVASANTKEDIRTWLPGRKTITCDLEIPHGIKEGSYTLCVSIIDPCTREPGMELAIEGRRSDGRYNFGTVTISKHKDKK